MLTRQEVIHTAQELQENYRRLAYPEERVLADTKLSSRQLQHVLQVNGADFGHVWMVRDYLEEMLQKERKEVYPFSLLADHSANRWFSYEKPWKH
ncbi:Uncharacterized protein conserved in bacteria [Chlamydia trachomatis]|nr:Uncharacterized protein conserved in bacteria [Chlamydia trachomatis]